MIHRCEALPSPPSSPLWSHSGLQMSRLAAHPPETTDVEKRENPWLRSRRMRLQKMALRCIRKSAMKNLANVHRGKATGTRWACWQKTLDVKVMNPLKWANNGCSDTSRGIMTHKVVEPKLLCLHHYIYSSFHLKL